MENKQSLTPARNGRLSLAPVMSELKPYDEHGGSYFFETREPEGLLEFCRLIVRHKASIILSSVGGLLLGLLTGIPLKPVYRASTTLEVLNVNEDFMNMRPTQPAVPGEDTDNSIGRRDSSDTAPKYSIARARLRKTRSHFNPAPRTCNHSLA